MRRRRRAGRRRRIAGWPVFAQLPAADRPQPPYIDVHDYKIISTPTLADLFLMLSTHTMMHAGQFTVVRRKLGKPVLM